MADIAFPVTDAAARMGGRPGAARRPGLQRMMALAGVLAMLGAVPVDAQRFWGRRGFTWQPEIQLAQEELARLQADLDRLSRDEWRARALAWIEIERPEDRRLIVTESWRVGGLEFKKKARVRALDEQDVPSTWEVVFDGEPQRKLAVVMTDVDTTRVICSLGSLPDGGGALGVFQHGGVLLCLARQPEAGGSP